LTSDSVSSPRLVNVPAPVIDEAASSWLSRVALSQGTDLGTVLLFLGIPLVGDVDVHLVGALLARVRRKCGLPNEALAWHDRVMSNYQLLGALRDGLLLVDRLKRSQAVICRHCIREMRTPYFPIHWRFAIWRWCPIHDCPMELSCGSCGARPLTLLDIAASDAGKKGFAFLNRCMRCGHPLYKPPPYKSPSPRLSDFRAENARQLANGRALLAALYYGKFRVQGLREFHPIAALPSFTNKEHLPAPIPSGRTAKSPWAITPTHPIDGQQLDVNSH
jgi:hypothetical protein